MKIALLMIFGFILGSLAGALVGIGGGLAWVQAANIGDFDGQGAMLVFFTFMPAGMALGGLAGAALVGIRAGRAIRVTREPESHAEPVA